MTAQWPFAGCWILLLAEMMTIALLIATYRSSGVKRRPTDLFSRQTSSRWCHHQSSIRVFCLNKRLVAPLAARLLSVRLKAIGCVAGG